MEKHQTIPSTQLEELVFNDEQEAKVGAALRALADQIKTTARSSKQEKEVIELLSDSDIEELVVSESAVKTASEVEHQISSENNVKNTKEKTFDTRQRIKKKKRVRELKTDPVGKTNISQNNTYPKYLTVAQFLGDDESDTLSESSEDSVTQYKFKYEQDHDSDEPTETKCDTQPLSASISKPSAYVTLTDITGENIQVEEIDMRDLMNGTAEKEKLEEYECEKKQQKETPELQQLNGVKAEMPLKQDLPAKYETAPINIEQEEESLLEPKQEIVIEESHVQPYCKEELTVKPDIYSNEEDLSYRNSLDDSNGLTTCAFGGDLLTSYDETDDDIVELSDQAAEEILIDLVDSETDDEQETGALHNSTNETKPSTTSIDCFMSYTCPECCVECGSFSDWKLHTNAEHKFSTIEALNMQTIIDKDGQLCYQCRDCEQKFQLNKTFYKLLPHRFKHLPNEDYIRCSLCSMRYRTKAQMRRHLIKSHYKICREYLTKPYQKRPNAQALKYVRITCPICNEPQATRKEWQEHLEDTHNFTSNSMQYITHYTNDIVICSICDVKMRKRSITDHMLTHEKNKSFACTLCNNYKAIQIMMALTHVRRVHLMSDKELLFKCDYCEATFEKKSDRKKHLNLKHKVKWQECAICHKKFFNISTLLSHMNFANHHKLK